MSKVFLRFRQPILAWDSPLAEFYPKDVMIQSRQPSGLGKGEPPSRVVPASQFDLHVALPLSGPQGKIGERLLVEFKRDAHIESLALSTSGVNLSPPANALVGTTQPYLRLKMRIAV
jgi:hypothetical protein